MTQFNGQLIICYFIIVMTDREIAWVSGLFEGEGTIYIRRSGGNGGQLRIAMTDEDVIRRLALVTRRGRVTGPHQQYNKKGEPYKLRWNWTVCKTADVVGLLYTMWPFLGTRRRERAAYFIQTWLSATDGRKRR